MLSSNFFLNKTKQEKYSFSAVSFLFISFFVFSVFNFNFISAQISDLNDPVFQINPQTEIYSAGDLVNFEIESFKIDLDKSDVTWILNGKRILSGFGQKKVQIKIPAEEGNLQVSVTSPSGESSIQDFRLYNKNVIIYWEATDSSVPDWYEGKRMLVKGGSARVHAFQNITSDGVKLSDSDILYTWEINGRIEQEGSGLGKNYLDIFASDVEGDEMEITLTIVPRLSNDSIKLREVITLKDSRVLLYLNNLLYSPRKAVFGSHKFNVGDFVLRAEPYFFSLDKRYNYFWNINGKEKDGSAEKGFRVTKEGAVSNIIIKIEHVQKLFQEAKSELDINF